MEFCLVLENNYLIDVSKYDAIIGYRADDSYFRFPEAFVKSEISFDSLEEIFQAGNLGKQFVLISKKAFDAIKYVESYPVNPQYRDDYYRRKDGAVKSFESLLLKDRYSSKERMIDLVRDYENK